VLANKKERYFNVTFAFIEVIFSIKKAYFTLEILIPDYWVKSALAKQKCN